MGAFVDPSMDEILADVLKLKQYEEPGGRGSQWTERLHGLGARSLIGGLPLGGAGGITGAIQPNIEPTTAPAAQTGGTTEVGIWGAATAPPAYAQIPVGSIRAPSFLVLQASGVITSSAVAQTASFTGRWGSSATLASNPSIGATGLMSLGASSAQTAMIWIMEAFITVRRLDSGGGAAASLVLGAVNCMVGNTAGAAAASVAGVGGITAAASFDALAVQGVGISVTPSAAGVSAQLLQYCLFAID
jgi:hypothetical protein